MKDRCAIEYQMMIEEAEFFNIKKYDIKLFSEENELKNEEIILATLKTLQNVTCIILDD